MKYSAILTITAFLIAASAAVFGFVLGPESAFAATATTTLRISVCGDGIVADGEVCDFGFARNQGQYSTSIAGAQCYPGCTGFVPYCGDEVLQPLYGEECDDMNNFSGDTCSAVCKNETPPATTTTPATGGGGGGGGYGTRGPGSRDGTLTALNPTRVLIDGKAYPNSIVYVLQDGRQVASVPTSANAEFHFETSEVTPGPVIFGFWAEDSKKRRSVTMTTTFQVVQNAVTTVSGVYLPPTIELSKKTMTQGTKLDMLGEAVASSTVFIYVDSSSVFATSVSSALNGAWNGSIDTKPLENEKFHTVKAKSETVGADGAVKKSGFSQSVGFYVGTKELSDVVSPDINKDGKVNLIDFSILLFNWNSSEVTCDFNRDSKVNLTDFSIMLYAWTG